MGEDANKTDLFSLWVKLKKIQILLWKKDCCGIYSNSLIPKADTPKQQKNERRLRVYTFGAVTFPG